MRAVSSFSPRRRLFVKLLFVRIELNRPLHANGSGRARGTFLSGGNDSPLRRGRNGRLGARFGGRVHDEPIALAEHAVETC